MAGRKYGERRGVGRPPLKSTLWIVDLIRETGITPDVNSEHFNAWLDLHRKQERYTPRQPRKSFQGAVATALRILARGGKLATISPEGRKAIVKSNTGRAWTAKMRQDMSQAKELSWYHKGYGSYASPMEIVMKYYHGGRVPGGKTVMPPVATGASPLNELDDANARMNRVYITTSVLDAAIYALRSKGYVYEVRPVGKIAPDKTGVEGVDFICKRARVVRIVPWAEVRREIEFAIDEMEEEDG